MPPKITCPTMLLHPMAKAPTHGSEKAAGYDIHCVGGLEGLDLSKWQEKPEQITAWKAMGEVGHVVLAPGEGFLFRTGFAQAIQPDHVCVLFDRSGMGGSKQVHRLAGVIDEDYRGEWFVRLINLSPVPVTIFVGDKIVQGLYQIRIEAEFPLTNTLDATARGTSGFGSTDKK